MFFNKLIFRTTQHYSFPFDNNGMLLESRYTNILHVDTDLRLISPSSVTYCLVDPNGTYFSSINKFKRLEPNRKQASKS